MIHETIRPTSCAVIVFATCAVRNFRRHFSVRRRYCVETTELKDLTSTSFGYIIGFLLPGIVSLYGFGLWYNQVPALLGPTANPESTLGPSLVFLLVSLAAGLLISAIRWVLYERLICRKKCFPADHFQKLKSPDKLSLFKAVVDEHYRYHQFFAGMSIGLIPAFGGWLRLHHSPYWKFGLVLAAIAVLEALLVFTGMDSYCKYIDRGAAVIKDSQ